jgi:high-affinity iron transporter
MKTFAIVTLFFLWGAVAHANWQDRVTLINAKLDEALAADAARGKQLAEEAYYAIFEGEPHNMEVAIRVNISGRRAYELESQFTELRQAVSKSAPLAQLEMMKQQLVSELTAAAREMDGTPAVPARSTVSAADTFGKSLLIILREGIEIILILGAITAFLIKAGARDRLRVVASGVIAGIVASVLTALLCTMFVQSLTINPEIIEGCTLALAAIVLFFVSHWLISKAESKHWVDFIKSKVHVSLSTGNMTALWISSFLAVYREGAETVLFYQGLAAQAPGQGRVIVAGLTLGCAALLVVFLTFRQGILRIPPRPFFRVTSALLYYMAFVFAGKAVVELQAGQVLHLIPLRGWPTIEFLGVYPTVQSLAVQGLFIAAILISMALVFVRRQPEPTAA